MSCSIKLDPSAVTEAKLWRDAATATQTQYEAAVRDLLEARKRISRAVSFADRSVLVGQLNPSTRDVIVSILAGPLPPKAKAAAATDRDEWGKR